MFNNSQNIKSTISTYASRESKKNAALNHLYYKIDDRNTADFLLFIVKLAKHVKYFDQNNILNGDWTDFFASHEIFIAIKLNNWNIDLLQSSWLEILKTIDNAGNSSTQKSICLEFFTNLKAEVINQKTALQSIQNETQIKESLLSYIPGIEALLEKITSTISQSNDIGLLFENPYFEKTIAKLFGQLQSLTNASNHTIDNLLKSNQHHPHITLILTFLDLFQFAQQSLNTFTQKHLAFYYSDVLKFKNNNAISDSVYLEVEPKANKLLIPTNTKFLADKDKYGIQKIYTTLIDQTIDESKIKYVFARHTKQAKLVNANLLPLLNQQTAVHPFAQNTTVEFNSFCIASKLLFLHSGKRTININIHTENGLYKNAIDIKLTAKDKWLILADVNANKQGIYNIILDEEDPAIVAFQPKFHNGIQFEETLPLAIVSFSQMEPRLVITKIELAVEVAGTKNMEIVGEHGTLDINKPFLAFGPMPANKSILQIYIPELFQKPNGEGDITIQFDNENFNNYALSLIDKNKKNSIAEKFKNTHDTASATFLDKYPYAYLTLQLNDSSYDNQNYLTSIIQNATDKTPILYLPKITSLHINYRASEIILNNDDDNRNQTACYIISPTGFEKINSLPIKFINPGLQNGQIIIGINNKKALDTLQLYFHIQADSTNPLLDAGNITYTYFNNNLWHLFDTQSIADDTLGCTQSGTIKFSLPQDLDNNSNTLLAPPLTWIKIETDNKDSFNGIIGIHTQMILAHLDTKNNFNEHTAPFIIKKSLDYTLGIKKIIQHYSSFGGKSLNSEDAYYQYASQLLRHKNRAITSWDYESIILEAIPAIASLKILPHYKKTTNNTCNLSAGYVTIVPIATNNKHTPVQWQPIVSKQTINELEKLLHELCNPHARIRIQLPQLEQLKVYAKIVLHKTAKHIDLNIITSTINNAINNLISPWAYQDTAIQFFEAMSISKIIQIMEAVPYVAYLKDVKINHNLISKTGTMQQVKIGTEYVYAQTPYSIFIPSTAHDLEIIK